MLAITCDSCGVLRKHDRSIDTVELASDVGDHQVSDFEGDVAVHGINPPLSGDVVRDLGAGLDGAHDCLHDECQVADRRYLSKASMAKLYETDKDGASRKEVGTQTKELLAS